MTRLTPLLALVSWAGVTLVLSTSRWASRPRLVARLDPYVRGPVARPAGPADRSGSLSAPLVALLAGLADSANPFAGARPDVATRLARAHLEVDPGRLRAQQAAAGTVGFAAAGIVSLSLALPAPVTALLVVAVPTVAFLWPIHRLEAAARRRRERLALELPVVAEQIGMLLATGHSLGGALDRLARRGSGVAADDLADVVVRIRQGLDEHEALAEWAGLVGLPALDRFVAVLALHRHAGDLGQLIAGEADAMRRDAHRGLLELIERRAEQVWIPVTVATLVPGLLFLAVPFVHALDRFGGP